MGSMSASDAAPLPRLGEVYFDVRGESRSMRLSWYADTGVAVFSIWQGGTCTGTFRLPIADLPRMVEALQRGPHGDAGDPAAEQPPTRAGAGPGRGPGSSPLGEGTDTGQPTAAFRPPDVEPVTGMAPAAGYYYGDDPLATHPTPSGPYRGDPAAGYGDHAAEYDDPRAADPRADDPRAADPRAGGQRDVLGAGPGEEVPPPAAAFGGDGGLPVGPDAPDPLGVRGGRGRRRSRSEPYPPEDAPPRYADEPSGGFHADPLGGFGEDPHEGYHGDDPHAAYGSDDPHAGYGGGTRPGYGGERQGGRHSGQPAGYVDEPSGEFGPEPEPSGGFWPEPPPGYPARRAQYGDTRPVRRHGQPGEGYPDAASGEFPAEPPGGYPRPRPGYDDELPGRPGDYPPDDEYGESPVRPYVDRPRGTQEDPEPEPPPRDRRRGRGHPPEDAAPESFPYGPPPGGQPRPGGRYPGNR